MFLVLLYISWWQLQLRPKPIQIPGEPSPPSLLGPLLWALSLLKHQQGETEILWYEKRQEALLATALPWTPPTFSFQVDLWGASPTPSTHREASAWSRVIVTISDVHTFGPWTAHKAEQSFISGYGLMAAMELNHFDKNQNTWSTGGLGSWSPLFFQRWPLRFAEQGC